MPGEVHKVLGYEAVYNVLSSPMILFAYMKWCVSHITPLTVVSYIPHTDIDF